MKKATLTSIALISASCLSMGTALASSDSINDLDNDQNNWAKVRATLNANLDAVTEEVELTSAAIGNSFAAELGGRTNIVNDQALGLRPNGQQFFNNNVTANVNLHATDTVGSISATAAAIGNSASITVDDPQGGASRLTQVTNNQVDYTAGARARIDATIAGSDETVELTSAAINNSFSADVTGNARITNTQFGVANNDAIATTNLTAYDTVGAIAGTTAAIGNSAAIAFDNDLNPGTSGSSLINNNQFVRGQSEIAANLNVNGSNLSGPDGVAIETTAAAIANSFSVEGEGSLVSNNLQRFNGDARAVANLTLDDITGDVTHTSAAIANSASYDIENADHVTINNRQWASYDPTAITNATFGEIDGDVSLTSAAITNTLSVSTLPSTAVLDVNTQQYNGALTQAVVNADIGDVTGNVSITAAAIGNTVNIVNLPN